MSITFKALGKNGEHNRSFLLMGLMLQQLLILNFSDNKSHGASLFLMLILQI